MRRAEVTGRPLDGADPGMIEHSDNDAASTLWQLAGASDGVGAYDAEAGLSQTALNTQGYWGEPTTSALDQLRLLRQLSLPGGLLDAEAQRYALGLMTHVEPDQAWGITGGVPAGVSVALKNGWLPVGGDAEDWEINSIGRVKGDGRWYLVAVLTAQDPSIAYGIDTIAHMSGHLVGIGAGHGADARRRPVVPAPRPRRRPWATGVTPACRSPRPPVNGRATPAARPAAPAARPRPGCGLQACDRARWCAP